jgi:hypothetical protein
VKRQNKFWVIGKIMECQFLMRDCCTYDNSQVNTKHINTLSAERTVVEC